MDYVTAILSLLVLVLAVYIILRQRGTERSLADFKVKIEELNQSVPLWVEGAVAKTFQSSSSVFENIFSSAIARNADVIKGAFATSLKELGIQEDLGKLKEASSDLKGITSDLKSMFQVKQARAKFGELQLEMLLKDIFPSKRLNFQKNIGAGIPDACILVEEGRYLCIDSKFPLENFRKYSEAENAEEKSKYWNEFLRDVRKHIEEIKGKYVGKENTLDFAFMFVPSDVIFYHIVSESPEIAVEASKSGVILASPSVLPAYLNLVSARIKAEEISERAEEIQRKMDLMGGYIDELGSRLETLFRHINNAYNNVSRVQQSYTDLRGYYSTISNFDVEVGE
ncbi:hypothetical protein Asulf_01341 [Archaeoglobus sulfaticallidus PM70-1]|uniref:DNA recombination protein RmuC n=1 Tax=Archaeoglobus sulfaticallidus PM70-1 TaxID=387631 RepID=N0BGA5_9EURY|nr:DNA recombination protein RmuC [Archaeoglobus sulfaticallidus]AGK61332.1 hypothetical protein Asulf_01341 [Archaeoglobus sulfaticallidus PM70-1]